MAIVSLKAREPVLLAEGAAFPPPIERGRTGAPPPSSSRSAVEDMNVGPASTYLLLLQSARGETVGFKIGWAADQDSRLDTFNSVSLPELDGLRYSLGKHSVWSTAQQAFDMEQAILKSLHDHRLAQNQEVVKAECGAALEAAWAAYLLRSPEPPRR